MQVLHALRKRFAHSGLPRPASSHPRILAASAQLWLNLTTRDAGRMTFAAWYGIIGGMLMFGQWVFFLVTQQVPELETEPVRLAFHLTGEFVTAVVLIAGGVGLLAHTTWGRMIYPVAIGMLIYTVIVSPGYFAQKHVWPQVGMFAVLLVLALTGLALFFQGA